MFESSRPSQPVRSPRVKLPRRHKTTPCVAFGSASRSIRRHGSGTTTSSGRGAAPSSTRTWWQTETGGILISPLAGATVLKPGSATRPFFGIVPQIVDDTGAPIEGARRRETPRPL